MAIFGRKKDDGNGDDDGTPVATGGFTPDPDKAKRWFDHARTMADTGNFAYALNLYASGIKLDPGNMDAHNAMYEVAVRYVTGGGKPASSKDIKQIDGSSAEDKFAAAEYAWMTSLNDASTALKLMEAAIKAEQGEFGRWLAPRLLNVVKRAKKPSKSSFVKVKDLCSQTGAWDEAFKAGEEAVKLDPSDAALVQELRQLTAQSAIQQGNYSDAATGKGNFKAAVKDNQKQQDLEDSDSISGGDAGTRGLDAMRAALEEDPDRAENYLKLGQALRRSNTTETVKEAHELYIAAYERLGQYRFRMMAGDILLAQARAKARILQERAEKAPDDSALAERAKAARDAYVALKAEEYTERATKYPTDRQIKFELGLVQVDRGDYEAAMASFQAAKDEPKFRVRATHLLGRCFAEEKWFEEAVQEFKESLDSLDATNRELELPIRYDMMLALLELARERDSREYAQEAADICSAIIRKDITYRDIRQRKREIDELVRSLG